jgi:hypothetical protein
MPKPNLSSMSVDALLTLRGDINKILDRKANELRSQLSMLGDKAERRSGLKGTKVPPNIVAHQARLGQAEEQSQGGWLRRSREERRWRIF